MEHFGGEIHGHTMINRLQPCGRALGAIGAVPCQLVYWNLMTREEREQALLEMAECGGLPPSWTGLFNTLSDAKLAGRRSNQWRAS